MRLLSRTEWKPFCDRVSREVRGGKVELEVVSLSVGDRFASRWVSLIGIAYDPRADILEIALPDLDHAIEHPRAVWADETSRGLVAIEIANSEGGDEILRLREPLLLPSDAEPTEDDHA